MERILAWMKWLILSLSGGALGGILAIYVARLVFNTVGFLATVGIFWFLYNVHYIVRIALIALVSGGIGAAIGGGCSMVLVWVGMRRSVQGITSPFMKALLVWAVCWPLLVLVAMQAKLIEASVDAISLFGISEVMEWMLIGGVVGVVCAGVLRNTWPTGE